MFESSRFTFSEIGDQLRLVIHRTLDFGIGRTDTDTRKVSAEPIPIPIPKPIPQKVIFWTILDLFANLYSF